MPLYEYQCSKCGKVTEFLIRTQDEQLQCDCGSRDLKRILSTFAVSANSASVPGSCIDGSCGLPSSPCASGMCGL